MQNTTTKLNKKSAYVNPCREDNEDKTQTTSIGVLFSPTLPMYPNQSQFYRPFLNRSKQDLPQSALELGTFRPKICVLIALAILGWRGWRQSVPASILRKQVLVAGCCFQISASKVAARAKRCSAGSARPDHALDEKQNFSHWF